MRRKLPWAVQPEIKASASTPRAILRKKRQPSVSAEDDEHQPKIKPHRISSPFKPQGRRRYTSRTPSTSPPPAPPDEEFMLEGYNGDDIYIMVEDEFQAVAQSFTQHLHHAEYMRMKKKARENPRLSAPYAAGLMSTEAKRKLKAKALHTKQDGAIKTMTGGLDLSDQEDAKDDDPWVGTTLAGLMTTNGSQQRTALVGLEKIPSSTRAAQGFSRGEGDSSKKRQEKKGVIELYGKKKNEHTPETGQEQADRSDEGDDLNNAPSTPTSLADRKVFNRESRTPSFRKASPSPSFLDKEEPRRARSLNKVSESAPPAMSKWMSKFRRGAIDRFDDGFNPSDDLLVSSSIAAGKSLSHNGRRLGREKDKKSRADEIPTFLV